MPFYKGGIEKVLKSEPDQLENSWSMQATSIKIIKL